MSKSEEEGASHMGRTFCTQDLANEGKEHEGVAQRTQQGHQGPWDPMCPHEDSTGYGGLEFGKIGFDFTQGKPQLCGANYL